MAGYWIARGTITDEASYAEYARLWAPVGERFGARFIAAGGKHQTREGTEHTRVAIIEFPSYEQALTCYDDPEYQATLPYAHAAYDNKRDLIIVDGITGADSD